MIIPPDEILPRDFSAPVFKGEIGSLYQELILGLVIDQPKSRLTLNEAKQKLAEIKFKLAPGYQKASAILNSSTENSDYIKECTIQALANPGRSDEIIAKMNIRARQYFQKQLKSNPAHQKIIFMLKAAGKSEEDIEQIEDRLLNSPQQKVGVFNDISNEVQTLYQAVLDENPKYKQIVTISQAISTQSDSAIEIMRLNNSIFENPQNTEALLDEALQKFQERHQRQLDNTANVQVAQVPQTGAGQFKSLKEQYQGLKGNISKAEILKDFKSQIELVNSKEELSELKTVLEGSEQFKKLQQHQGLLNRLPGLKTKTSSEKAFGQMFKDQEALLEGSKRMTR